jgi:glycosyltransferase involved in cell wall biosynthesis
VDKLPITKMRLDQTLSLVIARRFEHKRGILIFIDALACLKKMGVTFTAQICTVGGENPIKERLVFHGIEQLVTVTEESMDSVLNVYEKHHIAVVPTLWSEGTSLACIEAISAGLPVIVSPVGGLGNLVIPGFNGLIVNPEPQDIADAIAEIWRSGKWHDMHQNCLSMREVFNISQWQKLVLAWLQT